VLPSATGAADTLPLHRDAVAGALLGAMQSSGARSRLPGMLRAAAGGTTDPLVEQVVQYRRQLDQFIAMGMHLSVSCADAGSRLDLAVARATDGHTFLGSSRVRMLADACAAWAEARRPRARACQCAGAVGVGRARPQHPAALGRGRVAHAAERATRRASRRRARLVERRRVRGGLRGRLRGASERTRSRRGVRRSLERAAIRHPRVAAVDLAATDMATNPRPASIHAKPWP